MTFPEAWLDWMIPVALLTTVLRPVVFWKKMRPRLLPGLFRYW
jgi:hypothetical protein